MEKLAGAIEGVIRDLTAKKTSGSVDDPAQWLKKALTKKELGHIKFHYFRKGVYGVLIDSSVWMYSLNLKKESILNKIKEASPAVKELRFSLGETK
jgi:hypothetical protein